MPDALRLVQPGETRPPPDPLAAEVRRAVEAAIAPLVEAFDAQARRFDLLASRLGDVTLSKDEAAVYLGVSSRTLDRKVETGKVQPVPGGRRRFTIDELDRALRAGVFAAPRPASVVELHPRRRVA